MEGTYWGKKLDKKRFLLLHLGMFCNNPELYIHGLVQFWWGLQATSTV